MEDDKAEHFKLLSEEQQSQMVALLKELRDSFAWDYDE